jgi:hypothetical protein
MVDALVLGTSVFMACGFDSHPAHSADIVSAVERCLGKTEVTGSNPVIGLKHIHLWYIAA